MACQGMLCADELCGIGIGRLENKWDGVVAYNEE